MSGNWKNGQRSFPTLNEACAAYFREQPVFDKLLRGFREKYASYGAFSGTVCLRGLKSEEVEILEGFFRKSFHGQKSVRISAKRFEAALKDSRFGDISPEELLRLYFGEEIAGKKDLKNREELRIRSVFQEVEREYGGTPGETWLREMLQEKNAFYLYFLRRYREAGQNPDMLRAFLELGAKILCFLPANIREREEGSGGAGDQAYTAPGERSKKEYLPVFAARLTGNPHCFDEGTQEGRLLYQLILWSLKRKGIVPENAAVFPALQRQKIYLEAGILKDDISNYVVVSGVRGMKKDETFHAGMEGFLAEGEAVMVALSVLAEWKSAVCCGGRVYIVENPSVFSVLCGKLRGKYACMCMNGQPRLASVLLLDLFAEAGTEIFYAGDFDPEGLLIAQKVRQYYKGDFSYWHMTETDYDKSCSEEEISPRRLKMLERITDPDLSATAAAVRGRGLAGYQENIWNLYMDEKI